MPTDHFPLAGAIVVMQMREPFRGTDSRCTIFLNEPYPDSDGIPSVISVPIISASTSNMILDTLGLISSEDLMENNNIILNNSWLHYCNSQIMTSNAAYNYMTHIKHKRLKGYVNSTKLQELCNGIMLSSCTPEDVRNFYSSIPKKVVPGYQDVLQ